jgi:hypothetical protein
MPGLRGPAHTWWRSNDDSPCSRMTGLNGPYTPRCTGSKKSPVNICKGVKISCPACRAAPARNQSHRASPRNLGQPTHCDTHYGSC